MEKDRKGKGPGRPRTVKPVTDYKHEGIVQEPMAPNVADPNDIELIYSNPSMFKKISNAFKVMSVDEVTFSFKRDRLELSSRDHKCTSTNLYTIYGEKVNRYYCFEPISMTIDAKSISQIFQTIDKDSAIISILIPRSMKGCSVRFVIYKSSLDVDKVYNVDVCNSNFEVEDLSEELANESNYMISYRLPYKYFKKDINDYSSLTDEIKLEKKGEKGVLKYTYSTKGGKIKHESKFKKSETIDLVSKVKGDDLFLVSFQVEFVKPIANALISEYISVSANPGNRLIFTCNLDDTSLGGRSGPVCIVKIFTQTNN
jgi:hypothetical protein